jgi:hypothetical protein
MKQQQQQHTPKHKGEGGYIKTRSRASKATSIYIQVGIQSHGDSSKKMC